MNAEPIGERLKKLRQQKGLSLEEVHKKTKIHINILKAIEGESLTNLSPIYLKGFLKIYCNYLGLDPRECLPDQKESLRVTVEPSPVKPAPFLENAGLKLNAWKPPKKLKKIIIWLLAIAALGLAVFKIGRYIASRPPVSPAVAQLSKERPQAKPAVRAKAQPPASASPFSRTPLPKESGGGISLSIAAKENCLILVKVDGRVVLHRVLERGRSDSWKARNKIELSLGNAAAVELIVNGQRFTNLGRKGQQLKNITITEKDGLRIPR